MPSERDKAIRLLNKSQAAVLRKENRLARDVYRAYERARKAMLAELADLFAKLGDDPTPAQIRRLANDADLIRAVQLRMGQLEREFTDALRDVLTDVTTGAAEDVLNEVELLAAGLDVPFFRFAMDEVLELTIQPAIEQIPGLIASQQANLLAELRAGLAQGQRFSDLANRALAKQTGIFRRGYTSAELMARRAVIQANNNSRLITMERAAVQVDGLQKQVVAAMSNRTTRLCLRAHGQIQDIDQPFELTSGPPDPFQRKMMAPPFHWNCRTTVTAYHPRFEERSTLKTADMRKEAQSYLQDS